MAGFAGVALGAFGAHALKGRLAPDMLAVFDTATRYELVHALAIFAAAWGLAHWRHRAFAAAGGLFVIGIVLFSGSLYALALSGIAALGAITPFGGLAFLTGWLCLAAGAWRGGKAA